VSWDQLLDIFHEDAEERRLRESALPEACPNDGYPLDSGPEGTLHCPFDGWQYPRDYRPAM